MGLALEKLRPPPTNPGVSLPLPGTANSNTITPAIYGKVKTAVLSAPLLSACWVLTITRTPLTWTRTLLR